MSTESKKVWVVGHKNPDTDSICAAISYAYLKNQSGDKKTYVAKRAGAVNEETRYVLERFGVEEPPLVTYAGAQIKDINIRKTAGVSNQISLKRAWELMKKLEVVTLPVTNQFGKLEGVIVTKDIATSYMDVLDNCVLSKARTQYKTIAETIDGEVYAGNEHAHFVRGKVVIATSNPEYMADYIEDDDLVILGDREEAQMQAIRSNASCIIIGGGLEVAEEVKKLAEKRDCVIITTPFDTFPVARLINQSMPIKQYMTRRELVTFDIDDYVDDVKDVMSRVRHRDFPVLGSNGNYVGMISRRNLMNMQKKQIILVDHNEKSQAVDGIVEAEILEIIDHHRLGSLETVSPVYFRNQPLGCTSTIIYQMYQEQRVEIPKEIAGLLLSAIISDTLMFRSPTCTPLDKSVAKRIGQQKGLALLKRRNDSALPLSCGSPRQRNRLKGIVRVKLGSMLCFHGVLLTPFAAARFYIPGDRSLRQSLRYCRQIPRSGTQVAGIGRSEKAAGQLDFPRPIFGPLRERSARPYLYRGCYLSG